MSKIFIGTPMYGGNCTASYLKSMLNLQMELIMNGHEVTFFSIQNESLITRGRNIIADAFLKTDAEYLLFIDADHGFNSSDILKMIQEDLDILCAIPPKKAINFTGLKIALEKNLENLQLYTGEFAVYFKDPNQEISTTDPFEIMYGGSGLMLIKRRVFEELKNILPTYKSDVGVLNYDDSGDIVEFFSTEIVDNILLSEDYLFCKRWRDLGGKIYAAPWVRITHIGTYEFSGSFPHMVQL